MPARVGIDLIAVEQVRESIRRHDDRYLDRVYTDRELDDCRGDAGVDAERLAARFAAKEAAIKVLRPGGTGVPWCSIGVRSEPAGAVSLELDGAAAELAAAGRLSGFDVSLTHERGFAAAVVIAEVNAADE